MLMHRNDHALDTLARLGTAYTHYRLVLSIVLSCIFVLALGRETNFASITSVYIWGSLGYILCCALQLVFFLRFQYYLTTQLFLYLVFDVAYITLLLVLGFGPNVAIVLLYMVVVLAATLLITSRQALFITLLNIIIVVYQQFFLTLFADERVSFYGNSAVITLIFISTYLLGQMAIRRMKAVEHLAHHQSQAILELQSVNQNIVEQLATGCIVINQDGYLVAINQAARQLLNWQRSSPHHDVQMYSSTASDEEYLQTQHPDLYEQLRHHQCNADQDRFYYNVAQYNFHQRIVVTYQPLSSVQHGLTLISLESLQHINQQAQRLKLAALGQLSASIAHEIRNPLAAIAQANALLLADENPDQAPLTQIIAKQCTRINRIIEDTLNMSRQPRTQPQLIDLSTWIVQFVTEDLSDQAHFIQYYLQDKVQIWFDPQQLRQVLTNLIRNAIRHGHAAHPDSLVHLCAYQVQDQVYIDVIDEGGGVPLNERERLFSPFFSTSIDGTGLGLYLSKTFCEANQAILRYIAQPQGSCFRIECSLLHEPLSELAHEMSAIL